MNATEQIDTFCSVLLGGPDGQGDDRLEAYRAYLWTISTDAEARKRTRWLQADSTQAIASAASTLARQQPGGIAHVYVGTGLMATADIERRAQEEKRSPESMRATNDRTAGLLALAVDIDVLSDVHASKPYPPDIASARRIYQAVPLAPTMIVNTGNGLHAWWVLAEPWLVEDGADPDAERAAMYRLAHGWSATLRFHADRIGQWKIDSTFDLARVMRMPGTLNVKDNGAKSVVLESHDPALRYEVSDFEAALADPEVIKTYTSGIPGLTVAELPGVDLAKTWARVNSTPYREAQFEPSWLTDMLEVMPGSALEAVWLGDRTVSGDPSPSGVDASLVRLLINTGHVTTEHLAEAIMCRRLRSGEKVEKVDPHRRTDYLVRTIARIQASAEAAQAPGLAIAKAAEAHIARAAAGRVEAPEREVINQAVEQVDDLPTPFDDQDQVEPEQAPPAEPVEDEGEFEDVALAELDSPDVAPPPRLAAAPPPKPTPKPKAPPSPVEDLVWPERHADMAEALKLLGELLIPEPYRKADIEIWRLEYRDFGEAQKGRMVLRIPPEYHWPGDNAPPTRRAGRPFYCSWYKRDAFDVPKGYRQSLSRDALIPASQIGGNRDAWVSLIDMLVPYWQRDSSGSDIVTQMHEWLLDYLVGHAATTQENIAVDNNRALLLDHANWGATGAPTLLVCMPSFLDFVAQKPGGSSGRQARTLVGYLELEQRRPRLTGSDGKTKRRASWYEVSPTEFGEEEWEEILDAARDAMESQEKRMRVVKGGRQA